MLHSVDCVGPLAISRRILPSLGGSKIILNARELLCFSTYLFLSSSPLSSEMASFLRLWMPVTCSRLVRPIGPGWVFQRPSSFPEQKLLASSCKLWTDLSGESIRFIGGTLVFGDGVGWALLIHDSAFFCDMSFSMDRRCSRRRISSCSCVLSLCAAFISFPLRCPLSRSSYFLVFSISCRNSSSRLLPCCIFRTFLFFSASLSWRSLSCSIFSFSCSCACFFSASAFPLLSC